MSVAHEDLLMAEPDPEDESGDAGPPPPRTGWVWSASAGWIEVDAEHRTHWDDNALLHGRPPR